MPPRGSAVVRLVVRPPSPLRALVARLGRRAADALAEGHKFRALGRRDLADAAAERARDNKNAADELAAILDELDAEARP